MHLPRTLFCETNYDTIDWDKNVRYVIKRVVTYGTMSDWNAIRAYYGMDCIRDEMLQSSDLRLQNAELPELYF